MKSFYRLGAFVCTFVSICSAAFADGHENIIWNFTGGADGNQPRGELLLGKDGLLYGTASSGGTAESGTVFAVDPKTRMEQTLYQFTGGADGSLPMAGLIQDSNGVLYGTTARNGGTNAGTVFSLTPPSAGQTRWVETTLWSFSGGNDGAQPISSLVADNLGSGVLYGTTSFGGAYGLGVVFSLTPPTNFGNPWTENTLWSFTGGTDGARPTAGLIQNRHGILFGTASIGGQNGAGTVFRIAPASGPKGPWVFSLLWGFTGGSDGANPMGKLTLGTSGQVFGTTQFGGSGDCAMPRWPYYVRQPESETKPAYNAEYIPTGGNACGIVFQLTPIHDSTPWTETVVWSFKGGIDGGNPVAELFLDDLGALHGMSPQYGEGQPSRLDQYNDKGNIFTLKPPPQVGSAYSELTDLSFIHAQRGTYPRAGLTAGKNNHYYFPMPFGGAYWEHVATYGYGSIVATH